MTSDDKRRSDSSQFLWQTQELQAGLDLASGYKFSVNPASREPHHHPERDGSENKADMATKEVPADVLEKLMTLKNFEEWKGRHPKALNIASETRSKSSTSGGESSSGIDKKPTLDQVHEGEPTYDIAERSDRGVPKSTSVTV